jgi:hypothetical protein
MVTTTESGSVGFPYTWYTGFSSIVSHKLEGLKYVDALFFVDKFISEGFSASMECVRTKEGKDYTVVVEKYLPVEKKR